MAQAIKTAVWFDAKESEDDMQAQINALSIRVNQLEKAHNRLAHLCGAATEGTTIDRDNWAKNEMGQE